MVGGVRTKSRTNPYPQKKPDPAWILQRGSGITHLWKIISQDPGYSFLRIAISHKCTPPAEKYQITANGKEGGREEDKHLNQFGTLGPGTSIRIAMMQNIYTP